ncbi:MAG: CHASE2 domain-containing protein, partial [Hydrogenophaga sp.]|nr:CHASE2 domain-containing protein [Hydrogenophaga sp.]
MPQTLIQRSLRAAVMLVPLLLAALHALGFIQTNALHRLDHTAYDMRLRASMPGTLEPRVVIVDIDSESLAAIGPWPWPRAQLAHLVDTLFEQQEIAVLGFDIVFPKPDPRAGGDAALATALRDRPVVLGYFFSNEPTARNTGLLPAPVMSGEALNGRLVRVTRWDAYESNIPELAQAAPRAGAFNALPDSDGVVRSVPLLAEYQGQAYESLALAVFRRVLGSPSVEPGFATGLLMGRRVSDLESLRLAHDGQTLTIPVDERVAALVPYRGPGGP